MNGKKAKLLRMEAKILGSKLPDKDYSQEEFVRLVVSKELQSDGTIMTIPKEEVRATEKLTNCVRSLYKGLKKEYKENNGDVSLYGITNMLNKAEG